MADLINMALAVTNLATPGAAAAARIQIFGGTSPNQFLVCDLELTGANNTSLVAALNASPATTTTIQFAAAPAPLPGIYNAI
jgi:hypothetical protein